MSAPSDVQPTPLQPRYDPQSLEPMREDLRNVGFRELLTAEQVEDVFRDPQGTILVMINSVCGCSAAAARPGVMLALQNGVIPDRLVTVFAGQDIEATGAVRQLLRDYPPSSPCVALFKEGRVAAILHRRDIERSDARGIAAALAAAFDELCSARGPSIPRERFEAIVPHVACGATLTGETCD